MYVKKVKKTSSKSNGKSYTYLHLVENVRTEKGPRQRLLLNLGALPLKENEFRVFSKEVERTLSGQTVIVKPRLSKRLKQCITQTVTRLLEKQGKEIPSTLDDKLKGRTVESIDTKSIQASAHHSIGAEHVCHSAYQELRIDEFLETKDIKERDRALIEGLVIARLLSPGSEQQTKHHLETNSGLYELMKHEEKEMSLNAYYRASDILFDLKNDLETHLCDKEKTLFDNKNKIVLYDLTNTYIEGQGKRNSHAAYGRSKEKRSDCLLMTLGMALAENGCVKKSQVFSGNQGEVKTLKTMLDGLGAEKDSLIVMDAGISSKDNLEWLREEGYHYLVCSRQKVAIDTTLDYETIKINPDQTTVKIAAVKEGNEIIVHCKSDRKAYSDQQIKTRTEQMLTDQLQQLQDGLSKPRCMKKYNKVMERIGRIKEKYASATKRYTVTVAHSNGLATEIKWEIKPKKEPPTEGFYHLRTSDISLSGADIWQTYRMLNQVEDSFRYMKSHLGMRPIFHQRTDRAETHLFISVLAYRVWNLVSFRLKQKNEQRSWPSIQDTLRSHVRYTLKYDVFENDSFYPCFIRQSSELTEDQRFIYTALHIPMQPLPTKKLSVLKQM
jgi:transposase